MKKTIPFVFVALMLAAACNNQPKESTITTPVITEADKQLMARAQELFQPLPARAESADNPITEAKASLGKVLYYDTRLSKTGNNSCNSCHNLATFGVDNLPTSKGDAGKFGDRNSPTVLNAAFHTTQFWDGRAKDVEEQAGGPILNPAEMAIPSKEFLVAKLKGIKEYNEMFKAAYPSDKDPITYPNIQKSIAAFERTLVTPSQFDNYLNGDHQALSVDQKEGLKTFIAVGCIQCHSGVTLGGSSFQKFGVYGDYRTHTGTPCEDEGRKKETKQEADKDFFKVPGLRNIEKTAPYFHNGCVADLPQTVKIMAKAQLNQDLSDAQVTGIVTFLKALTADVPEDAKKIPEVLAQK